MEIFKHITIDEKSRVPKYRQIVDSVIKNIATGTLKIDEKIPSINALSEEFYLSRDTVEKAYNILKDRNIITSVKGKGFYVTRTKLIARVNILFMVNKLSNYKMQIYNSFVDKIKGSSHVDLFVYHCDESLFLNLLRKNLKAYDYFVIMPHFKTNGLRHISTTEEVQELIDQIPKNKLLILDNILVEYKENFAAVYQDYEMDIYGALKEGLEKIKAYRRIIIAYPMQSVYPYPKRILHGFRRFCVEFKFDFEVIDEIYEDMVLLEGDLFITIAESDLVNLVKQVRDSPFQLGKDIGIISYNETPLKDLLGITTISTDFVQMGASAAELILDQRTEVIKNPFRYVERASH